MVLDAAVSDLVARLEKAAIVGGVPHAEVLVGLESLAAGTRAILEGEDPSAARAAMGDTLAATRLIGTLRSAVLSQEISHKADAGATLDLLRALDALQNGLFDDDPESLAARLSSTDGLELLVEVAHDLRSPLTSILFLSETLRTGHSGDVNPQQRSQLGLIYGAALGLASLASDVVDLAREGRGLLGHEPEPFSLAGVVHGVEDLVRPMAEEKGLELRPVLPGYDGATGHPLALRRVLLNLTVNALKFTDKGYVEFGVRRLSSMRLEFYVRDTGRGISTDRQRELFLPFKTRAYTRGDFFSGSGVGLSMARRLVRLMGSELVLETAPGWGTRFCFVLDVAASRQ